MLWSAIHPNWVFMQLTACLSAQWHLKCLVYTLTSFIQAGKMQCFVIIISVLIHKHDVTICPNNITQWNDLISCCNLILLQDCPSSHSTATPSSLFWQLALCLLRVRWAIPAFCSSLPPGVFFSFGMSQTASKGSAVARREGKSWQEATNRGRIPVCSQLD